MTCDGINGCSYIANRRGSTDPLDPSIILRTWKELLGWEHELTFYLSFLVVIRRAIGRWECNR